MAAEVLLVGLAGVLAPLSVWIFQLVVDRTGYANLAWTPVFAYIAVLLLREGALGAKAYLVARMKLVFGKKALQNIAGKFSRIQYAVYEKSDSQDVLQKIAQAPYEPLLELFHRLLFLGAEILSIVGFIFVVGQIHFALSLLYIAFILVSIAVNWGAMGLMVGLYDSQSHAERKMLYLGQLLSEKNALMELKVFGAVQYIVNKWKAQAEIVLKERLAITIKSQCKYALSMGLDIGWIVVVLVAAIGAISSSHIGIGVFIAVVNCSGALAALSSACSNHGVYIARNLSVVHQSMQFEKMEEIKAKQGGYCVEDSGGIEFRDVSFAYPGGGREVLSHMSFQIKRGEVVALVGENGAGKSTVVKLLCNLYAPDQGRVLIDGRQVGDYPQDELSRLLGVVFQDFTRFSLTVRENVALGCLAEMQNDALLGHMLQQAGADELAARIDQPLGKLDEKGVDLSGGQWQKLAIARALFSQSRYLLLDEPTASLDPTAESDMYQSFRRALKGRGGIIISHRLASACMADRILVLDKGAIAEEGSHASLLEKDGLYAKMWRVQSEWYTAENERVHP